MSKASRRKGSSRARNFDRLQQKLTVRVLSDLSELLKLRTRARSVRRRTWPDWLSGIVIDVSGFKGDPAPDSATLSKVSGTTVTVTVTLPANPAPSRSEIYVYASQDPQDFEETELAYSALQPSGNQLGSDYDIADATKSVFVKLVFVTSAGRKHYLATFQPGDLTTVLDAQNPTDVEIGLDLLN